jgi:hypothetical protein
MTMAITCPTCENTCAVPTPADACVWFHECECCGMLLRPKDGDCCVLCSYGERSCPPTGSRDLRTR